jgi:hypothetical protein
MMRAGKTKNAVGTIRMSGNTRWESWRPGIMTADFEGRRGRFGPRRRKSAKDNQEALGGDGVGDGDRY